MTPFYKTTATVLAIGCLSLSLSACAPMLLGGAAISSAISVTDRRTSGAQVEDQAIEFKAASRVREAVGDRGRISVTSYNRTALITGEVPTEADKAAVERAVSRVDNLHGVVNELAVQGNASFTTRSSDTVITSKVKATYVDAKDLQSNAIKVLTERGTVYLMGRVTEREATRAADLARSIPGVLRVIRVFEVISEAELAELVPAPAPRRSDDAAR